jgi:hypothetical protein
MFGQGNFHLGSLYVAIPGRATLRFDEMAHKRFFNFKLKHFLFKALHHPAVRLKSLIL